MRTLDNSAVKSAGRALDLLEFFARAETPQSFKAISGALGIPASSLSQLLSTLGERGFVEHVDRRGGYRAGPAFDDLVMGLSHGRSLIEQVRPLLAELRSAVRESVGLNLLRGDQTEVADAVYSEGELTYRLQVGATAPLYVVAAGKVFLAAMPDADIQAYVTRTRFTALTRATIKSGDELWREIRQVRVTGFAYSREEASTGVVGVARALTRGGRVIAALTVGLPAIRYSDAVDMRIRQGLMLATERFEAAGLATGAA